jgi:hypothetical protein
MHRQDAPGRQDQNSRDRGLPPSELYSETNDNSLWPPPHHYARLMARDSKLLVPMGPTQSQTRAVQSQNVQPRGSESHRYAAHLLTFVGSRWREQY